MGFDFGVWGCCFFCVGFAPSEGAGRAQELLCWVLRSSSKPSERLLEFRVYLEVQG